MECFINLGSVTYAMKAKEILLYHGIKAYIEKSRRIGALGCGYGVRIKEKKEEALKILRNHAVKIYSVTDL